GSTPRIVIQGFFYPANVNFADTALFTSSMGQLTPFDMTVSLTQLNATTLRVILTIYKEDTSSLTTAEIYGVIAEDTLMFTSNNGEPTHHDVFRKAIWSANPQSTPLPVMVNTSVSVMQDITINNAWDLSKVFAMVMLHNGTDVIQVAKSAGLPLATGNVTTESPISIYPNPANDLISISGIEENALIEIKDLNGRFVIQQTAASTNDQLDISALGSGLYILTISSKGNTKHFKLLKQ
ncbi:MAG TPA: T9SS type A sorting domain-containing protein, partial [Flavipsychrobacter sp.]|nr:T9SS type A sorting domain-containing protein [Flavipsychrobacter sp.]